MEANYDEKLQQAIINTIAEFKGWVLDQDHQTGAIFFTNGNRQIYATPPSMKGGMKFLLRMKMESN